MDELRRRGAGRLEGRMNGWMAGGRRMENRGVQEGDGERRNVKAAALESDLGRKVALPWRPGESSVAAAAAERKGGSGGVDSALQRAARLFTWRRWRRPIQTSRSSWNRRDGSLRFAFIYPKKPETISPLFPLIQSLERADRQSSTRGELKG